MKSIRVFCLGMLWALCLGFWGPRQKAVAQSIENIRIESDYRKVRLTYDLLQGSGNGSPMDVSVVFRSESGRTIVPTKVSGDYLQVLPGRDKQIEWDAYAELGDFSGELYAEFSLTVKKLECGQAIARDIDGNTYKTVKIGNQCWTQSNLKVSKYRNGDNIPTGLSNSAWANTTSGAYAIYDNKPVNDGLYGKLYNHYAVTDSRGLCPTGWHVPSDAEWTTLENQLGGSSVAGGALKSTAMQPTPGGWISPNAGATNSSGFTALPGGLRGNYGDFRNVTDYGYWWSSSVSSGSSAWIRYLGSSGSNIYRDGYYLRSNGFSVRCCRD